MEKEYYQKQFKKMLIEVDYNQKRLAELLGVSENAVSKKISNFSWRYTDLVNLLDQLGYDVVWVKRDKN